MNLSLVLSLALLSVGYRDKHLTEPLGNVSEPIVAVNCTGTLSATSDVGPQFCQGVVTAIEPKGFLLKPDAGFPIPDATWTNVKVISFESNGLITPSDTAKATVFKKDDKTGLIRVTMSGKLQLRVGQHVVLPNRKTPDAILLKKCHDLTVDVMIYAGGNHGITCLDCERVTVRAKVLPAPAVDGKPGRLLSSNADGVRFTNCRDMRADITVEAAGDDAFNSHGFVTKPAPGWNERLYLTGKVSNCYGGVKASGKAIVIENLEMSHMAGVLHLGADYGEPFDSGPLLEHNQVEIRGLVQDHVGFSLAKWPSLAWGKGQVIVASNLHREGGELVGDEVHYLLRRLK